MIAKDCETTGLDRMHGALPFFFTAAEDGKPPVYWEAAVDPLTRCPRWTDAILRNYEAYCNRHQTWVYQSAKFDILMESSTGVRHPDDLWGRVEDTVFSGHILASNSQHNLTDMAFQYLGVDIKPLEDALEEAVKECRRIVQQAKLRQDRKGDGGRYTDWAIAEKGRAGMPSAKSEAWRFDYWLPKAMALDMNLPDDHAWRTVLTDYACADAEVTLPLWKIHKEKMRKLDLWDIYQQVRRKLPAIVVEMERGGITVNRRRLEAKMEQFRCGSTEAGDACVRIAATFGCELSLPKSGTNKSLMAFCFGDGGISLPVTRTTDSGAPSLDKDTLDAYAKELEDPTQVEFVTSLRAKRKQDTAVSFLEAYERFALPLDEKSSDWCVLYPSINATGTDTLRFTMSNPNGQQVSKQDETNLREGFGPPPGQEWWCFDFENVELRIPFYESGEKKGIDLFEKSDEPPYWGSYHLLNASIIYPDEFWPLAEKKGAFKETYKATLYQWIKNFGFAFSYGCGERTGDRTAHKRGAWLMVRDNLTEHTKLNDRWVAYANRHGYVETIPDKTVNPRRGYPLWCSREFGRISPTVPLCYHVSGTAMQATCKAMIRTAEQAAEWRADGFPIRMVAQIHDELIFQMPYGGLRNLPRARKLQQLMEQSGDDIGIPLRVAMSWHPESWAKSKETMQCRKSKTIIRKP